MAQNELTVLRSEINELLKLGAISPCRSLKGESLSSYFLDDRKNKLKRFIFNLKALNKFIEIPHFKLEDARTACKLVTKNCYMANLDLKNLYFSVPVEKRYRQYLRLSFEDTLYEFNCIPYGLNICPFVFTKIINPVVSHLRGKGLSSVIYLDDFLFFGTTFEDCLYNVQTSIKLHQSLGFVINYEKSCLIPSKSCNFSGFTFISETLTLELPSNKREKIGSLIEIFLKKKSSTIQEFSQLIGSLISCCPAIPYGMGYTKAQERAKFKPCCCLTVIMTNTC